MLALGSVFGILTFKVLDRLLVNFAFSKGVAMVVVPCWDFHTCTGLSNVGTYSLLLCFRKALSALKLSANELRCPELMTPNCEVLGSIYRGGPVVNYFFPHTPVNILSLLN